ncbi:MAG: hypothetical protein MJ215_05650 [Spirochaetia bacterium]|nr:hypothetical protein [Spirochaetia bacterium]
MNRSLTLVCVIIYTAVISYLGLSLFFSDVGLKNYEELKNYKIQLVENIEALQSNNERLIMIKTDLETSDAIACKAAGMGIIGKNQRMMIIDGAGARNSTYSLGNLCKYNADESRNSAYRKIIRILSVLISLIFAFILIIFNFNDNKTEKTERKSVRCHRRSISSSAE